MLLILLFDFGGVDKVQLQAKATTVGRYAELAYSYRKRSNLLKIQKLTDTDNLLRIYTSFIIIIYDEKVPH